MDSMFSHLDTAHPKDGWVILGPGGGGCVHLLTVNPHRPDTMLVSCDMTAGYITHNGGRSWREFNLKSRQYAYAFDPVSPDTIYVGTSGLFRSEDNGATWRLLFPNSATVTDETRLGDEANHAFISSDNWPGKTIHAILVDPLCPKHIFIVIKKEGAWQPDDDFYARRKNGLYIFSSLDRGQSWEKLAECGGADIQLLALDQTTPVGKRTLVVFTERAVWRIPAEGAPEAVKLPDSILMLRHACCGVDPTTGKQLFFISAVAADETGRGESVIWKSADPGLSWQKTSTGLEPRPDSASPVFSQVSACACDARRVYLIAEKFPGMDQAGNPVDFYGILKSADAGATWQWVVKMSDDHEAANRTGGWAERDYGAAWGDLKGEEQISPRGRFAWDVVASPTDPDTCYTMDFSTIFKTCDGGVTWEQVVTNIYSDGSVSSRGVDVLGAYGVFFDPFDPHHIALAMTDVGIFHSYNRGRTWLHALAGTPRDWINTCYWIVFDPEVRGRAWSAWSGLHDIPRIKTFQDELLRKFKGGICKTSDNLQSWQPASSSLPVNALCTHLLLDPSSPVGERTLYAAVFGHGVYKSTDDGSTWNIKNNGIDPRNTFAWRLVRRSDGRLYLVVVKNRLKGRECEGAVYASTDGAEYWEKVALPEGVDFPNDLTCDPSGRLYLACWPHVRDGENQAGGAYASHDGGQTWIQIFDPAMHVYTVTIDPANPAFLYLSTFDAAVYRSHDSGQNWDRLRGFNFQWCYRPVLDPHQPGMVYLATFGSSVWYGPAEGVAGAVEDIVAEEDTR